MDIINIIEKKSNKKQLNKDEILYFVNGYCDGTIPDYQISALLMAIKINGMTDKETFLLTDAMLHSGKILDFKDVGFCTDKHSTGGISDTTTIALAPICAAAGINMFKLSGRSLGFTGGTIDKLEAFDGFKTDISLDTAKNLMKKNKVCIMSANWNIAPADKKIYALRDVTGTVESIPLIASSIMSKKLASGADAIVLDIKYGNGAFMKTKKDALALAKLMVKIGEYAGKKMDYVLNDMNEPLGYCIGNKLEAYEAIEVLSGKKGKLYDTIINLAGKCISLALNISPKEAVEKAVEAVESGKALSKLKQLIKEQGGSLKLFKGLGLKPKYIVTSPTAGILTKIDCPKLGFITGRLGAMRQSINDTVDNNVGIKTFHKLGSNISCGDVLFEIYAKDKESAKSVVDELLGCYTII